MRQLNGVWVDVENRRVPVQGESTWGDVDREAQAFGLAVPGGVVSTTGVAGLTLGGGIGWLHRKWGLACYALRGLQSEFCIDATCRTGYGMGYRVGLVDDARTTADSATLRAAQIIDHHNRTLTTPYVTLRSADDVFCYGLAAPRTNSHT